MINSIRKFLFYCFRKLIPINYFIEAIENEKINLNEQHCIKDASSILHKDARIINLQKKRAQIRIGKNCIIRGELFVNEYGGEILIGNDSSIGENSKIWSGEKVTIGNRVHISHNVNVIDTNTHSVDPVKRNLEYNEIFKTGNIHQKGDIKTASITIEDDVWVSFNVSILKGVVIGKGAVIAADTLITKDVPPFTMVAGNPANIIKSVKN
ncbi:MAG TPA: acyltransferase [Candidatus Nitrosocosmicus sp.]